MKCPSAGSIVFLLLLSLLVILKCFLICFWCFLLAAAVRAQNNYYAPQTFRQQVDQRGLFNPESSKDVLPQSSAQSWSPGTAQSNEPWRATTPRLTNIAGAGTGAVGPVTFKPEPWRLPYSMSKEQQAAILHHKQALTSEGAFRFEYASDNGLAAGEQIEPDGTRVGAYQYKDPSGQLVKLKYRAGKEGFQILEGSHIPKSPEPVAPATQENHYQQAYAQQRQQYELQQQYNQQRPDPNQGWRNDQGQEGQKAAGGQYFVQNLRPAASTGYDDGQYRENEVENRGPHSFGEGYAFAFQG